MNELESRRETKPMTLNEPSTDVALSRFVQKIHHQITLGKSSESLFEFVFDFLNLIIPYDRIGIALLKKENNKERLVAKWIKSRVEARCLTTNYSPAGISPSLTRILRSAEPRIIDDLEEYLKENPQSESTRLILKDGIRSSLTCALIANNEPIGLVFFSSVLPKAYRPEHARVFLEVADELSLIVEHARLREISKSITSKDQNFRMAIHDLKSPLGIIQGFLQLAREEGWYKETGDTGQLIFDTLNRNALQMSTLIEELSELTRLESGAISLEMKAVELGDLLRELVTDAGEFCKKKEMSFRVRIEPELPAQIICDRAAIKRALDNLFSNAVKYSCRNTSVTFSVKRQERFLRLSVSDQGQGIPESEIPKLFFEFGKTSVKPTEGESSTGLGLAIVKKIVFEHRGQVSVESRVGEGSTFSVLIPVERY